MKTLHFYLLRQVLATLAMTVLVFTFVLLLGESLKSLMEVIVSGRASLGLVFHMLGLLTPWILSFSLPMGMLTAALLVCGRFSADQELVAVRASGVSLVSLVTPILLLGVVMSALCLWINCEVAPSSRVAFKTLASEAILRDPGSRIRPGQFTTVGNYTIYAGKVVGTNLSDVMLYVNDSNGNLEQVYSALRANILFKRGDTNAYLHFEDCYSSKRNKDGWSPEGMYGSGSSPFPLPAALSQANSAPGLSDMTFRQLSHQLGSMTEVTPPQNPGPQELEAFNKIKEKMPELRSQIIVNMHRQVAFSFSCIGFTLIGIPLGIRAHRRETSIGIAIALLLVLVYYSFVILGQAWDNNPGRYPHLLMWVPNFLFQIVGGIMLWKANKRG